MRGVKTKALRKVIYGDMSLREKRKYVKHEEHGDIRVIGLRAKYQAAKKTIRMKGVF